MFDVGFSELMVIAIVALVVIGPERLPKVARTAGLLLGRLQRYVNDVKSDISREMQLDELKKLQAEMQESARSFERSISSEVQAVEQLVDQTAQSVEQLVHQTTPSLQPVIGEPALPVAGTLAAPDESDAEVLVANDAAELPAAAPASADRLAAGRLRRRIRHIRRREMNDA